MGELKVLFMKCAEFPKYGRFQIEVRQKRQQSFAVDGQVVKNLLHNLSEVMFFLLFLLLLFLLTIQATILHSPFSLYVTQMLEHKTDCNLWKSITEVGFRARHVIKEGAR